MKTLIKTKAKPSKTSKYSVFYMCQFKCQLTLTEAPNVVKTPCVHAKNAMLHVITTRQLVWYGSCKNGLCSLLLCILYFICYFCHFQVDIKSTTLFSINADINVLLLSFLPLNLMAYWSLCVINFDGINCCNLQLNCINENLGSFCPWI